MRGFVRQRSPGSWQHGWKEEDAVTGDWKRKTTTFRGTKKQADAELAKIVNSIHTGTYVEPKKLTVREFLERWLADYVAIHIEKTLTREGYARRVKNHLIPSLGAVPLAKLTAVRLQEFYRAKLEGGLSPTSVNDLHRVLHVALESAIKWGLVARNVCDAAEPPKKQRPDLIVWTPAECSTFLEAVRASGNRYYPVFAAALFTGMRQGELLGLRWQDVDLDRALISVQQTLETAGTSPRFGMPKTKKSRRTVPIPPELVSILRTWKAKQNEKKLLLGAEYPDYGLVFTIAGGGPISHHNLTRRDFAKLIDLAGVPHVRFHDLRHSHASVLLAANVHPKIVSERLGHSTIGITMDLYSHTTETLQRDAANVVGRLLASATD
jgi:integrase